MSHFGFATMNWTAVMKVPSKHGSRRWPALWQRFYDMHTLSQIAIGQRGGDN
jgi:hypothetical protein